MTTRNRVPAGVSVGGQFAPTSRTEASVRLPAAAAQHVSALITAGRLSPAGRGMDPREAIEQMAEAEALNISEKAHQLARAGLSVRDRADTLVVGDVLIGRDGTRREVEHTVLTERTVELETDEGVTLTLDRDERVDFELGHGRCSTCGEELDLGGWDGLCGSCADADESDGD
ncbi:hypothetical protein [Pseudactinotalea terrae]|uniref:hypothetical protein n=1 Tax=Pseudactinotalea terrae TaxID=1743262 RepID=UPI0012E1654D|nr:hypothetical protein [Pseudactinotalea terrae]